MTAPSFAAVFLAGLLAFASPCVLPLLPGFVAFMSGDLASQERPGRRRRPLVVALAFAVGFGSVFVTLGATASGVGRLLLTHRALLEQAAGGAVVLVGLAVLGVARVPLLSRELRFHPDASPGVRGSVLLGAAFALGWSPCVGPTLAVALAIAAGQNASPWQGALLLAGYSAGLGAPFVLLAVGSATVGSLVRVLRRHAGTVNAASGTLLVCVGLLMLLGEFSSLSATLSRYAA